MTTPMPLHFNIITIPTCESTNVELRRQLEAGQVGVGSVLVCDWQTQGRGRRDRHWVSPRGNVAMSLVLPLPSDASQAYQWGLVVVLSLQETLTKLVKVATPFKIKWPNDIINNELKLAGILSELVASHKVVIVGVGLNLNSVPADFPDHIKNDLTTVKSLCGHIVDKNEFIALFLQHIDKNAERYLKNGFHALRANIDSHLAWRGQMVQIIDADTQLSGNLARIDSEGLLEIKMTDSSIKKIIAGDVSLRRA